MDCDSIMTRLDATTRKLEESIAVVERLRTVGEELAAIAAPVAVAAIKDPAHPLPAMLERLHACYSMAQERTIHARFAAAETAADPAARDEAEALEPFDDDSALF